MPATTLLRHGFTIARNFSDEAAAASFCAMGKGVAPDMAAALVRTSRDVNRKSHQGAADVPRRTPTVARHAGVAGFVLIW